MIKHLLLPSLAAALAAPAAWADDDAFARAVSGPGTIGFLAVGTALPFARDGQLGTAHGLRALEALGLSVVLSEGLKRAFRVPRPDTGTPDSFPSGHATAAFAVAAMESSWHPREALLWYGGATLIAGSRVSLGRHRPLDIVGGAALGWLTARAELSSPRGILISPWLPENRAFGLTLHATF